MKHFCHVNYVFKLWSPIIRLPWLIHTHLYIVPAVKKYFPFHGDFSWIWHYPVYFHFPSTWTFWLQMTTHRLCNLKIWYILVYEGSVYNELTWLPLLTAILSVTNVLLSPQMSSLFCFALIMLVILNGVLWSIYLYTSPTGLLHRCRDNHMGI